MVQQQRHNPAIEALVAQMGEELAWAQIRIRRAGEEFELRHVEDGDVPADSLRLLTLGEARHWAQFTGTGAFRPLKSAPNLQRGWLMRIAKAAELEFALNQFYPGSVADWFALRNGTPPVTHYREFTARQTGMYRIATHLDDTQAAQVIRSCCDVQFCLKRRLWTVAGLDNDAAGNKSLIPCLEPCALLLELARKNARIEQAEKTAMNWSPDDLASLQAGMHIALAQLPPEEREADFASPSNPRRIRLALEKLKALGIELASREEHE